MYLPTVLATSASIPFFAAFIAEREGRVSEDLIAVAYFCAVGLLLSFAAVLGQLSRPHDMVRSCG